MIRALFYFSTFLLFAFVLGATVDVSTDYYHLSTPGDSPNIFYGPINNSVYLQETSFSILSVYEAYLPVENDPLNYTVFIGSTFTPDKVTWTASQSSSGETKKISIVSTAFNQSTQSFSSISLQINWDDETSQFNVALDVNDYTWFNSSDNTILVFNLGISDDNNTALAPTVNATSFNLNLAYGVFSLNASINGSSITSPIWLGINDGNVVILGIGHFDGSISENFVLGNYFTIPSSGGGSGSDFWEWFIVVVIALAVVGIIGALVAGAVGFFIYKKKQQQALYDNI